MPAGSFSGLGPGARHGQHVQQYDLTVRRHISQASHHMCLFVSCPPGCQRTHVEARCVGVFVFLRGRGGIRACYLEVISTGTSSLGPGGALFLCKHYCTVRVWGCVCHALSLRESGGPSKDQKRTLTRSAQRISPICFTTTTDNLVQRARLACLSRCGTS